MLTLRPYQSAMISGIREQLKAGKSRILAVAPTGSGKTALTAHMIANATAKNKRCWFLNHRRELVHQSVTTLQDSANVNCGIIASGFGSNGYHLAQVASIQTLMRRWEKYILPDLIIVDECQHVCAASWTKLLSAIVARKPDVKIIGLTASPIRLDGRGLGQWFDVIVEGPNTATLIEQGYLAKYRMWGASLPDLTGVHTTAGDYNKSDLEAALSRTAVVGDALAEYKKHCDGKRALVFMWSIRSSQELAQRFNDTGIPAMHVDGETNSLIRDRAIADFRNGRIRVISNVELFGEGLDIPSVEAGFLMRPTQSLQMYLQQCGRILRPCDGKDAALIFDHAGHAANHGYPDDVRTWTLEGNKTNPAKKRGVLIRQCLKCYATVPARAKDCKWCGMVFPVKPREVETVDGELQELDPTTAERHRVELRKEQGQANSYEALVVIEKKRGYKPGWAWIMWNSKKHRRLAAGKTGSTGQTAAKKNGVLSLADSYRPKR